jgi:hypothetical protein
MIIGDLGRYGVDAHYKAQGSKLIDGLGQAVLSQAPQVT